MSMAQFALRWILMRPEVTCAIPGARRIAQVDDNCAAADLPEIPEATLRAVRTLYEQQVRTHVHHYW
jgi:aryl-alcohol dehydrogenase-like predicted oxidoreductase